MPESFNLTYDTSNRLIDAVSMSQWIQYEYDAGNKRILEVSWTGNGNGWTKTGDSVHFYGITGQRLGTYAVYVSNENTPMVSLAFFGAGESVWFGGRLVQKGGGPVAAPDRLGSIGRYVPYGEERTGQSGNPANGNEKFATYTRDGVTGLDYADQRWYAQGQGRFLTSDPYQASAGPGDPASWNRYAYVGGDPVGRYDPKGLDWLCDYDAEGGSHCYFWWPNPGLYDNPLPEPVRTPDTPSNLGYEEDEDYRERNRQAVARAQESAKEALKRDTCWKRLGYGSEQAALDRWASISFTEGHGGRLRVENNSIQTLPAPASTHTRIDGRPIANPVIFINLSYNWADFSYTVAQDFMPRDYLLAMNQAMGVQMTSAELGALIVLHELMHHSPGDRGKAEETPASMKDIFNACLKK
jgi:RHS repeat-associated protein